VLSENTQSLSDRACIIVGKVSHPTPFTSWSFAILSQISSISIMAPRIKSLIPWYQFISKHVKPCEISPVNIFPTAVPEVSEAHVT
jgi:hypothetical protein